MTDPANALTLQFLQWLAERPRSYADVMEAWRTSCPRLTIWEDARIGGLVQFEGDGRQMVGLTPLGRSVLADQVPPAIGSDPQVAASQRRFG